MNAPAQVPPEDRSFAVGEIAIVAVAIANPANLGQEREVMGLPASFKQPSWTGITVYGPGTYSLRDPDGGCSQAFPWQLRKKQRPDDAKSKQRETEETT